jgi:membrane protein implicated in regulation of membrane protease activity
MQRSPTGLLIIAAGLVLVIGGLLVWAGALSWFGRLPGDIRVERPSMRFYAPITSMLLLSVVLSLVVALVRKFWP